MQCALCHSELKTGALFCGQCGAEQPRRRFVFEPGREEFTLKTEEDFELGESEPREEWQLPQDVKSEFAQRPAQDFKTPPAPEISYGGFFRRGAAFLIDCFLVVMLSLLMGLMTYVGYKVGLAAYHRSIIGPALFPLIDMLITATVMLATGYFVLFHGMEGKTIGKWLLGLKVVGAGNARISYPRACLRWVGTIAFAPLLLGFLWVLWSREKRAWHDYLARTWVIRE
jgi:uncharacterized RDD family membrane protein YckC